MNEKYKFPSKNPINKLKKEMVSRDFNNITIKSYLYYIEGILNFTNKSPRDIASNDIITYLEKLVKEKKSRSTLNTAHSALKFYFENVLRRNFFAPHGKIGRAKLKKKIPKIPTNKDAQKIIQSSKEEKYKLILELLYKTGIKISEVLPLKKSNLDLINKSIKIKDRAIKIPEETFEKIKIYIVDLPDQELLFKNRSKKQLSERSVQKYFSNILKENHLNKRFTPNSLRHLFVFNLIKEGKTLDEVKDILGHKFSDAIRLYFKTFGKKPLIRKRIKKMFHVKH